VESCSMLHSLACSRENHVHVLHMYLLIADLHSEVFSCRPHYIDPAGSPRLATEFFRPSCKPVSDRRRDVYDNSTTAVR
jgi:hypothetical protein